ncbi:MAG TPA: hypothetical protein VNP92_28800, partial [Actinophytocola sp.]|nr:hypothetical protein [Actinophytocola sp.]
LHPLLPPPSTPLLSEEDQRRLDDPNEAPTKLTARPSAPPLPAPPPPEVPQLAPAPGPLPFESTARRPVRRRRGAVASALLVVLAVVLFFGAAGGGFALARVVGGEPLLPPPRTSAPPSAEPEQPVDELETRTGDAATLNGAQGGGYAIGVPPEWEMFVEERVADDESTSTRVYFLSAPDGSRSATVERFPGFYPDHTIEDYIADLGDDESYTEVDRLETRGIGPGEPALQLTYRTTTRAEDVAPGDPNARNLNRVTFANLLPNGSDLWVVSVTVPVDQEDTGRRELFNRIAPTFRVTG